MSQDRAAPQSKRTLKRWMVLPGVDPGQRDGQVAFDPVKLRGVSFATAEVLGPERSGVVEGVPSGGPRK
jgi:hypothetical protein